MKAKAGKAYDVDFSGVEKEIRKGGKSGKQIPEGDYIVKVVGMERRQNKAEDGYMFVWRTQIVSDAKGKTKQKGNTYYYNTSLKPQALFNLRNVIHALSNGKKNPAGSSMKIDPADWVGKQAGVTIEDDEYDGKIRSAITDWIPLKDLVDSKDTTDDDETAPAEDPLADVADEEPAKKKKKKKKPAADEGDDL